MNTPPGSGALDTERSRGPGRRVTSTAPTSGEGDPLAGAAGSPDAKSPDPGRLRAGAGERELAARASRGDVEAFSKLVRAHADHVRRVALRTLGSGEAEDAAQEVWIRVWRNLKGFRGDSAFGTWLHRIALNTCLDVRRRKVRRESREAREETLPRFPEPTGGDADPEASALNSERRERVRTALDSVRVEHRNALLLRHVENLSYADIAGVLEVPEGTAKGWASRGRAAMLAALSREQHAHGRLAQNFAPASEPTKKKIPEPSPNS